MTKTLSIIFIVASILFCAVTEITGRGRRLFTALSFAALDLLAGLGLYFSPSLTLLFLEAGMVCLSVGMVIFEGPDVPAAVLSVGKVLMGVGYICMIPAVYMYAFGEDHLNFCIFAALFLGIGLTVLLAWRGRFTAADACLSGLALCTGLFTVFCGLFSTMLLFAGFGMLCLMPVRRREDETFSGRGFVYWIGLFALACFSVIPAWL